jgi:phosphoadenosine phosphosulfate reductase
VNLIHDPRHSAQDLERFSLTERCAVIQQSSKRFRERVRRAGDALLSFTRSGGCYAGVSWGKDSVALAHLVATLAPSVPLVWVRVEPIANPDCERVRDAFLATFPRAAYHEVRVDCEWRDGDWHATGTLERGFAEASRCFGPRYLSGIRRDESGQRKRRMMRYGESSANTCAPIGFWSADDLWAHTSRCGLPVHPAYAFTLDGALDPGRIRVASLGGKRGDGWGRTEWELRYYRDRLRELAKGPLS